MKKFLLVFLMILGINQSLISQENIEITPIRKPDKSVEFYYTKKLPGSYFVKIEFAILENCYQTEFKGVIKNSRGRLFKLEPINKNQHVNFSYTVFSVRGTPNPEIDEDFLYVLPFKVGKSIKIQESASLKKEYFNAKKDVNWNSFVVNRNSADTIYNMRKGVVIEVIDEFKTDSLDLYKYTSRMNKILVEHDDGTVASYIGFNYKSIFVKPWQIVYPQTKLGVLDLLNNSVYRLYFDVSYLKKIHFDSAGQRTLSSEDLYEHLDPSFFSSKGPIKLKNNRIYVVEIDEAIRFKEFTKREKKKYRKSPFLFQ